MIVLTGCVDYEPGQVLGVYSTREDALDAIGRYRELYVERDGWSDFDGYELLKVEVDSLARSPYSEDSAEYISAGELS